MEENQELAPQRPRLSYPQAETWSIPVARTQTNSLSCMVYCSGASRNQNETLCVLRVSQALTRRIRSISVISVLWLFSRGGHRGTTDAWVSNHSKSTLGPVRLNKNTMCDVQLISEGSMR
jgi:hypothetical protein